MTTTVYDSVNQLVASDSRWSCELDKIGYPGHLLYIDDTGFGKIVDRNNFVMLLAGNGRLIELWKSWWTGDLSEPEPPVSLGAGQTVALHIIRKSSNQITFNKGIKLMFKCLETNSVKALFSGSGSSFAAQNWSLNVCARTAIEAAKKNDPYTGGSVRYVDFQSGAKNLEHSLHTILDVNQALLERGLIMDMNNPTLKHVSISAQEVADVRQMISNGALTPSAPTDKDSMDWDDESKSRLKLAIQQIREEETQS